MFLTDCGFCSATTSIRRSAAAAAWSWRRWRANWRAATRSPCSPRAPWGCRPRVSDGGALVLRVPVFFRRQLAVANFPSMLAYLPTGLWRGLRRGRQRHLTSSTRISSCRPARWASGCRWLLEFPTCCRCTAAICTTHPSELAASSRAGCAPWSRTCCAAPMQLVAQSRRHRAQRGTDLRRRARRRAHSARHRAAAARACAPRRVQYFRRGRLRHGDRRPRGGAQGDHAAHRYPGCGRRHAHC